MVAPVCNYLLDVAADPTILSKAGLVKGEYVLGVSSQSINKNFEGLRGLGDGGLQWYEARDCWWEQ